MLITILVGLFGLGLVVLVHELGHFCASKALGVEVEAFSLGWGPKILWRSWRGTEYRFSAFPIGGYCKMSGEEAFTKAVAEKLAEIPRTPGTFYGASPWKRAVIAIAGPALNMVFAAIALTIVMGLGYTVRSYDSRIVVIEKGERELPYPAEAAGLISGDRILSIDSEPVADFSSIQEKIALSPGKGLLLSIERDGSPMTLSIRPELDTERGSGRIGIRPWIEPIIGSVAEGGSADLAGLRPGDRIVSAEGKPVSLAEDLWAILEAKPERLLLTVSRGGEEEEARLVVSYSPDGSADLGFGFRYVEREIVAGSLLEAIGMGLAETGRVFSVSVTSLGLLFKGVNILTSLSGPARITYMVGQATSNGFSEGAAAGITAFLDFLALLSVGLFIMNLLPIPALDGGMILLCGFEALSKKPLRTKFVYRFQLIGTALVLVLLFLATASDILFFMKN